MLRNLAVASYVCIALGLLLGHEHKTTAALVFFTCAILISAGLLVNGFVRQWRRRKVNGAPGA
jgi:hypothetical protein